MLNFIKKFSAITLVFALCLLVFNACPTPVASAKTEAEIIRDQIAELQNKINSSKAERNEKNSTKKDLEADIRDLQKKISLCNQFITAANNQIADCEKSVNEKNEAITDTKEAFKKRIRSLYSSNTGSTIQILLGAESFSDFLTRTELTKCITAQDTKIVDELIATIDEINKQLEESKKLKAEQDIIRADLLKDKASLDSSIAAVNSEITKLNNGIKSDENDLKNLNNYMNALLYGGDVDAVFNGKFIWPVPGYYGVSCEFDSHDPLHPTGHMGMDITTNKRYGPTIVAAASGTITKMSNDCSHNYGKYRSCGCGNGFGNHVRISHGSYNGKQFLSIYGHMTEVAAGMHVNKYVTTGQKIGTVGSTGFSTGPHLHFAIAVNNIYRDPRDYIK